MPFIIVGFFIVIGLEYFLAKRKNKIVGLILPAVLLIATIAAVVLAKQDVTMNMFQRLIQMLYALLYLNLPTCILITIYLVVRKKSVKK